MSLLTRTGIGVALVLALVACTAQESGVEGRIEAQSKQLAEIQANLKPLEEGRKDVGRFQVMNGTPSFIRNIMLVDTVTGRTWLTCETKQSETVVNTNWCAMEMFGAPAAPSR